MTQLDLAKLLQKMAREHDKRIFTLREIAALAGISRPAAGMLLLRAEKNGVVARVVNCWINRSDPPDLSDLAFALASPSYLSFESALYRHGLLSQSPRGGLTVAVTGRPRVVESPWGSIRFIHLQRPLFFGFDSNRIAFPEKAWLDLLYIRGRRRATRGWTEEFYPERLNRRRLRSYQKKFPGWVQKS